MEPAKEPITIYTCITTIWEADEDSFSAAGRRFYVANHTFKAGDKAKITITKLPPTLRQDNHPPREPGPMDDPVVP